MNLHAIPAFSDNYIWLLADQENHCIVVDPGDAAPVQQFLDHHGLILRAILITHHHPDHTGGIQTLTSTWKVPVYGPAHEKIQGITHPLHEGEQFTLSKPAISFRVIEVPGHTLGHIAYYASNEEPPLLFCGDTLFASGCGRLFEGTPKQMDQSLQRLAALPGHSRVCCTHEYTLANLRFALAVLPQDPAINKRMAAVKAMRHAGQPSLPSSIDTEKACNPFLRVDEKPLREALEKETGQLLAQRNERFAALRGWKDRF